MDRFKPGDLVILKEIIDNSAVVKEELGKGPYVVEKSKSPWLYLKNKPCPWMHAWAACRFELYVEEPKVKVGEKYKFVGGLTAVIARSVQDGFVVYEIDNHLGLLGVKKIDDFLIQAHQYVEPPHVIKIGDKFHPDRSTRDFQIIGEMKNCEIAGEMKDWWVCLPDARYGNPVPYLRSKDDCPVDWLVKP